ncbi:SpaA isopeptide-forming pilin-related protein [Vagococcus lutrae]|uniref:SpaA isopeptide-forming pilin-related protein n=1 Tax=Vagococcus lutrae TaxID=81947 RepID=UPI00200C8ED0|nr:SpaA isopeptide-forming pilin-related protein [Vagococcus lutrae]MDT2824728.1 SpaA isopeptide-forming pilin-related protein [Vagococcus lutrae]UQF18610.1 SpaA isopeptide-forming pilin-related protein [Vagococcus lutrae]
MEKHKWITYVSLLLLLMQSVLSPAAVLAETLSSTEKETVLENVSLSLVDNAGTEVKEIEKDQEYRLKIQGKMNGNNLRLTLSEPFNVSNQEIVVSNSKGELIGQAQAAKQQITLDVENIEDFVDDIVFEVPVKYQPLEKKQQEVLTLHEVETRLPLNVKLQSQNDTAKEEANKEDDVSDSDDDAAPEAEENLNLITSEEVGEDEISQEEFTFNSGSNNNFRSAQPSLERFDLRTYKDLFEYVDQQSSPKEEKGIYPKHHSNNYLLQNGNEAAYEDNKEITTKNFRFGEHYTGSGPVTQNILKGNLNFANGYHHYNVSKANENLGVETKKTVKPRKDDPTKFDIQLDIIGDAVKEKKKVDVVFVIDKSDSMNKKMSSSEWPWLRTTRWDVLKNAMKTFANGLLNDQDNYDVQMGLASFGSTWDGNNTKNIFYETSAFNSNQYFTKNPNILLEHGILTAQPLNGSGTPTFIGVDAGAKLLIDTTKGARLDAEKHIIVLTDGMATFGPKDPLRRYVQTLRDKQVFQSIYNGNGFENQNDIRQLAYNNADYISEIYKTLDVNDKKYSIAFGVNNSNADIVLSAAGPDFQGNANDAQELNEVLNIIKGNILEPEPAFEKGQIVDPMSEYVDLVEGSVKSSALILDGSNELRAVEATATNAPQYAKDAKIDSQNNQINVSNLTLSASAKSGAKELTQRHGYRLNYTVKLKEDYYDNQFYPTNGPTFAQTANETQSFGFAVPSVRVRPEKGSLLVKKIWDDQENVWQKRQDIIIQLQRREKGSNGKWEDVPDQRVSLTKDKAETVFEHEFKEVLFRSGNKQYEYRVEERVNDKNTGVAGYEKPKYSHEAIDQTKSDETMTVINELKYLPLELKKVGHDGETPLADVGFTLYEEGSHESIGKEVTSDSKGEINFGSLPIGRYVLKETTPLIGYQAMEDIHFEIVQDETSRELSFKGLPENSVLVNRLKDFQLQIEKKDQYGRPVPNVTFQLKGKDYDKKQAADKLTGKGNTFTFKGLKPGEYTLEEVEVNSHYVLLEKPIKIVISDIGEVTIDDELLQNVLTKEGNIIHLEVTNTAKGILPATGGTGYQTFKKVGAILLVTGMIVMGYYLWRNRQEVA